MKFDQEFFDKLCTWIRASNNKTYDVHKLESDTKKFIYHLYWYAKKNKDLRHVVISLSTETEIMYGLPDRCEFTLSDIYEPGCCAIGFLPEEIRLKRMERMDKIIPSGLNAIPKPLPVIITQAKKKKVKGNNSDRYNNDQNIF